MMVRKSTHKAYRFFTIIAVVAALLIGTCSAAWSQTADAVDRSQRLSLNLTSVTLGSVLKVMTQKTGINFLIGSDLTGKTINVYLEDVLVEDALAAIMKANGLWYTRQKGTNIYVIMESPDGPPVATVTDVFHTDYADAVMLKPTIEAVLTEVGNVVVDQRTNAIVVSDIPENMSTIESIVRDLDNPTGQVLIEAQIIEVADEANLDLGVEWGFSDYNSDEGASYGGGFNYVHQWEHEQVKNEETGLFETVSTLVEHKGMEGLLDLSFGKWNSFLDGFQDISARIRAMERDGLAQVLATPQILTIDNQEAVIAITSHIAMAKKTTVSPDGYLTIEPLYGDVGVVLKVTPHVNNDDFVTMTIEPEVSSASRSSYFPDEAVDTRKRTAKTTVMAQDGETIIIGGLIRKDINETHFKVPLLGDIPLLGRLFRKSVESEVDSEVMVFLTPRILGPEALKRITERKTQRLEEITN
ncbi:MAG: secretin N-terminal domain-containing protein [Candidatus Eisenbacteria bacterium]|nr:secretin N-terminal domain-containing protein [Candidatus Eisenbacteria bacterium]